MERDKSLSSSASTHQEFTVEGSQGGELLILGTSFNNVLDGNNGSDTIDGFLGNDTMDGGGSGGDILSYGLDRAVMVATAEVQPSG